MSTFNEGFSITLEGAAEADMLLNALPAHIAFRLGKRGMTRTAARYRTLLRRDAPRVSGRLRSAIAVKKHKGGTFAIGLSTRYYYKTLDFEYSGRKGSPLHPWFQRSAERHSPAMASMLVDEAIKAVYNEADKAYKKSKRSIR
jgi:hypothetical protein